MYSLHKSEVTNILMADMNKSSKLKFATVFI